MFNVHAYISILFYNNQKSTVINVENIKNSKGSAIRPHYYLFSITFQKIIRINVLTYFAIF